MRKLNKPKRKFKVITIECFQENNCLLTAFFSFIQFHLGEYDKLGGTNEVADETTAPITSVIGSLDGLNPDGSYNYQQIGSSKLISQVPSSQYLPSYKQ